MKKIIGLTLLVALLLPSCTFVNRFTDDINYETITGKHGTVEVTVGSERIIIKNVKIEYSSTDTTAIVFSDQQHDYYYQEGFLFTY